MDSLTHLVAGALTPIAFRGAPKRAALAAFGIIAGEFPDIDAVFGSSPESLMSMHRGITHALIVQPLSALLVALLFYMLLRRRREEWLFLRQGGFSLITVLLAALSALYLHVFLDCMTTFGTQIFLPFSWKRVGFPAMFIVDLFCTVPALVMFVLALRGPADVVPESTSWAGRNIRYPVFSSTSRRRARIGLAWLVLYPLSSLAINAAVTSYIAPRALSPAWAAKTQSAPAYYAVAGESLGAGEEYFEGNAGTSRAGGRSAEPSAVGTAASANAAFAPPASGRVRLLTEPFSPFVWKIIVDEGSSWRMGTLSVFSLHTPPDQQRFRKADAALLRRFMNADGIFAHFAAFSSFIIQRERPLPEGRAESTPALSPYADREYAFMDLRYIPSIHSPARLFGRDDVNFVLEARTAGAGQLGAWRFLSRSARQDILWQTPQGPLEKKTR